MEIEISKWLSLISKKKRIKKYHRLQIAAFMNVLPRGAGNFRHDPSPGKFSDSFQDFQTLPNPC